MRASRLYIIRFFVFLALLMTSGIGAKGSFAAPESQGGVFPVYIPLAHNRFTSGPVQVTVLANSSQYTDRFGKLHIVGEVRNLTNRTIYNIWVTAQLYNRNNAQVASASSLIMLDYIAAGDRTCFDIEFASPPSDWYTYEFPDPSYESGPNHPRLNIEDDRGYFDEDSSGEEVYLLEGEVRNTSGSRVYGVKAVGTLYNRNGRVVSCSTDYIDTTELSLDHNQTAPFEIYYWDRRDYDDVADYRLQASCCPY